MSRLQSRTDAATPNVHDLRIRTVAMFDSVVEFLVQLGIKKEALTDKALTIEVTDLAAWTYGSENLKKLTSVLLQFIEEYRRIPGLALTSEQLGHVGNAVMIMRGELKTGRAAAKKK